MTEDLRLGVIGYGLRSSLAEHAHRPGNGARVSVVCDPNPGARAAARDRYGSKLTTVETVDELLSAGVEAVLILSPDHLHEEHATTALKAGLATYLEKPMATSVGACDRILRTAKDRGVRLYLGHNMRHMPFVREMKRLIDDGAIGEPKAAWCRHFVGHGGDFYFRDWHADRRSTSGLLLQKGAHDIDVLHWLMNSYTCSVTAFGDLAVYGAPSARRASDEPGRPWREDPEPLTTWPPSSVRDLNPTVDVEDMSMMLMRLASGALASYQQCHFSPDYWRNYTVIGTEGRLENVGDGGPGTAIHVWDRRHRGYAEPDHTLAVPVEPGGHGGSDDRIITEFLRYARDGGPVDTSPIAARNAVAAAAAATESLRCGGAPQNVPAMEP